jgi:hypothetical protein
MTPNDYLRRFMENNDTGIQFEKLLLRVSARKQSEDPR